MATVNVAALIEEAEKRAGAVDSKEGKFEGGGKSKEVIVLKEGDVVTIPEGAKVKDVPLRGQKNADGSQRYFQAVFGTLKRGQKTMAIAITPNMIARSFEIFDPVKNEHTGERAFNDGTAVDEFYKGTDLNDQMSKLYGKPFSVKEKKPEWSYNADFMNRPRQQKTFTLTLKQSKTTSSFERTEIALQAQSVLECQMYMLTLQGQGLSKLDSTQL